MEQMIITVAVAVLTVFVGFVCIGRTDEIANSVRKLRVYITETKVEINCRENSTEKRLADIEKRVKALENPTPKYTLDWLKDKEF